MSLEGLRAWIGEVERKLAKRTRVFLVLTVIAIGIGAAALYLAIDARDSSVSESDVQALQQQLETRIDERAVSPATVPATPPVAPESPSRQKSQPAPKSIPETKPEASKKDEGGTSGGTSGGATGSIPNGATGGDASAAKLQELVEQARERSDENK
jgi:hypothetical protein